MFFVWKVTNMNPALGPVNGDKQAVSVYDRKLGSRRTVVTTPDAADEFIKSRKKTIKDANIKGFVWTVLTTAAGAVTGAKCCSYKKGGAVIGAMGGLIPGSLIWNHLPKKADRKITQAFIEDNK